MTEADIGAWIDRCAHRMMALDPGSPLTDKDWRAIAGDLWHRHSPGQAPESAAENFMAKLSR